MDQRPSAADVLLTISRILFGVTDLAEALRQTCRELAHFTGADTAAVHLVDPEEEVLVPTAGYHIPKHAQGILGTAKLPVAEQGFSEFVLRAGNVAYSDDVQHDPRFAYPLFRQFPHRSGAVVPLVFGKDVAGAFYLVWWTEARRFTETEVRTLGGIGQQVALLLRNAKLLREAETGRRAAEAAEEGYRLLFERNLAGVFRVARDGTMIQCNEAYARLLGYGSSREVLAHNAREFYRDPADRERLLDRLDREGRVSNYELQWRRASGQPFWVMVNVTLLTGAERGQLEGIAVDVTDRKRVEQAEQEAAALRSVAELANATAREINNPLVVIIDHLELLAEKLGDDTIARTNLQQALDASRRISEMVAYMGRLTDHRPGGAPPTPR